MKHFHWMIIAYDREENTQLFNFVEITLYDCINEEWAINEAKGIVGRKFYTLRKVYECSQCKMNTKVEKLIDKQLGDDKDE